MPKKTTYARNTAQRAKAKQKSFELVRPASDANVLEAVESSEELESTDVETLEPEVEETSEQETSQKASQKRVSSPAAVAAATTVTASGAPKSASARMAARRQAQRANLPKTQHRSAANMVLAENYGYVRKDLLFILILAIIMFAIIIVLHFVLGS